MPTRLTLMPSLSFSPTLQNSASCKASTGASSTRGEVTAFLDLLPLREFAFWDTPDAGQGLPASDGPLSVLKQGIASRLGHGELLGN